MLQKQCHELELRLQHTILMEFNVFSASSFCGWLWLVCTRHDGFLRENAFDRRDWSDAEFMVFECVHMKYMVQYMHKPSQQSID